MMATNKSDDGDDGADWLQELIDYNRQAHETTSNCFHSKVVHVWLINEIICEHDCALVLRHDQIFIQLLSLYEKIYRSSPWSK